MNRGTMVPTILEKDHSYRVFLGFCDLHNISRIGYVDLDKINPSLITTVSESAVLDLGKDGCFDDNGVVPVSIIRHQGLIHLYYVGFQLGVKVPYYTFLGLAISEDNGHTFTRHSNTPLLDRCPREPFARCGAHIQIINNKWHMWYIGNIKSGWTNRSTGKTLPLYTMRHATSNDGLTWDIEDKICLPFLNEMEHGFGRPHVIQHNSLYKMFFCVRHLEFGYQLAYAESADLHNWERKPHEALNFGSDNPWDNKHKCFPTLVKKDDYYYLFYTGNNIGQEGLGYRKIPEHLI